MEKKFEKEFIADLAYFMKDYVKEIRDYLIDEAESIAANPMLCKLLHEYRVRSVALDDEFVKNLEWHLNDGFEKPSYEDCLLHPGSYRDVLYDLLVREGYRVHCEAERAAKEAA